MRTGEGMFLDSTKTTADAANFINHVVCNRCQVMNIAAKADKHWFDQYKEMIFSHNHEHMLVIYVIIIL